jgi:hypothetical protein
VGKFARVSKDGGGLEHGVTASCRHKHNDEGLDGKMPSLLSGIWHSRIGW